MDEATPESSAVTSPMSPSRLETFSDGVFAIAATLLILDVRVGVGDLGADLLRIWPSYAAYAVSCPHRRHHRGSTHHRVFTQSGTSIDVPPRQRCLLDDRWPRPVSAAGSPSARGGDLEPAALAYGATAGTDHAAAVVLNVHVGRMPAIRSARLRCDPHGRRAEPCAAISGAGHRARTVRSTSWRRRTAAHQPDAAGAKSSGRALIRAVVCYVVRAVLGRGAVDLAA